MASTVELEFISPPVSDEPLLEPAEFPIVVERQELSLLERAHALGVVTVAKAKEDIGQLPYTLLDMAMRMPGNNPAIGIAEIALTAVGVGGRRLFR